MNGCHSSSPSWKQGSAKQRTTLCSWGQVLDSPQSRLTACRKEGPVLELVAQFAMARPFFFFSLNIRETTGRCLL